MAFFDGYIWMGLKALTIIRSYPAHQIEMLLCLLPRRLHLRFHFLHFLPRYLQQQFPHPLLQSRWLLHPLESHQKPHCLLQL
ncbi:hypothetical protein D3C71_2045460 [compost metagenome]